MGVANVVAGVGVAVAFKSRLTELMAVAVADGLPDAVGVGFAVGVALGLAVGVALGLVVGVGVGVEVGAARGVGVGVAPRKIRTRLLPLSAT